jgi:hypothetical protein
MGRDLVSGSGGVKHALSAVWCPPLANCAKDGAPTHNTELCKEKAQLPACSPEGAPPLSRFVRQGGEFALEPCYCPCNCVASWFTALTS